MVLKKNLILIIYVFSSIVNERICQAVNPSKYSSQKSGLNVEKNSCRVLLENKPQQNLLFAFPLLTLTGAKALCLMSHLILIPVASKAPASDGLHLSLEW